MSEIASKFLQGSFNYSVRDVANFFLAVEKHGKQERITHLKLQKLVYYAQGTALVRHKKTLFNEEIQAWPHGPVCPDLYKCFRHTRELSDLRDIERENVMKLFSKNTDPCQVLTDVWHAFGKYTGSMLENMTHQETPWLEAIRKGKNTVITTEAMYKYFVQFLPGGV
jgi:uncharacterized phage-associated protein